MIPLPSAAVRSRSLGVELGLAEEVARTLVLEGDEVAQDDARRRAGQSAERLEVGLALVGGEVADDGAQVLEVEQRQAVLVGVVEDQAEAALLRVVEAEHLGQQGRAEARDGRADRDAAALAAEGEELRRVCRARPLHADARGALGDLVVALARRSRVRRGRP